jgi:hypothetical protein
MLTLRWPVRPEPPNPEAGATNGRLLHVSNRQFWGCLAVSLTVFVFATGPLWRHASDIGRLDTAIYWSYGIIPLLIGGCLLWSRRFHVRGFLLDTLALTVTKYVLTASVAIILWATGGDPQRVAAAPHPAVAAAKESAATPTVLDPARTGRLSVEVVDAAGRPVAGAHAYVARGLEGFVFAPPRAPVTLVNDGSGVTPALAVAQTGQPIEGRSTDGRLHTLVVRREGAALFNVPLLSSGAPTLVHPTDASGLATVRCNVHPNGEKESLVLLVTNPFHGRTDASGEVSWTGVPAGSLVVAAILDDGRSSREATVEIGAGATAHARLVVSGP